MSTNHQRPSESDVRDPDAGPDPTLDEYIRALQDDPDSPVTRGLSPDTYADLLGEAVARLAITRSAVSVLADRQLVRVEPGGILFVSGVGHLWLERLQALAEALYPLKAILFAGPVDVAAGTPQEILNAAYAAGALVEAPSFIDNAQGGQIRVEWPNGRGLTTITPEMIDTVVAEINALRVAAARRAPTTTTRETTP